MINLKAFSGKDDPRKYLNSPWKENGKATACNGYITIQLDDMQGTDYPPPDTAIAGRIPTLLAQTLANKVELQIVFPVEAPKKCGNCDRTGFVRSKECDECDGEGRFEHGSHEYDCKECRGEGRIHTSADRNNSNAKECPCCDGIGTLSRYIDLRANGTTYRFRENYLRLISALPAARLLAGAESTAAVRFEFEGGAGVVLPCRY